MGLDKTLKEKRKVASGLQSTVRIGRSGITTGVIEGFSEPRGHRCTADIEQLQQVVPADPVLTENFGDPRIE